MTTKEIAEDVFIGFFGFLFFASVIYFICPDIPSPKLLYVIDGDTIKVEYQGKKQSLRLTGIDAPEFSALRYGSPETGGLEATNHLRNLLWDYTNNEPKKNMEIKLENHGESVNEAMIADGYAKIYK